MSLVEVVAAIVLLAIILVSVINLLPQIGLKSKQNEDKQVAVNLVTKELDWWQSTLEGELTNLLANPDGTFSFIEPSDTLINDGNTITIQTATTKSMTSKYTTEVKIMKIPDLDTSPKKANQIGVFIYKNNSILVTENYGYVFYEG